MQPGGVNDSSQTVCWWSDLSSVVLRSELDAFLRRIFVHLDRRSARIKQVFVMQTHREDQGH